MHVSFYYFAYVRPPDHRRSNYVNYAIRIIIHESYDSINIFIVHELSVLMD